MWYRGQAANEKYKFQYITIIDYVIIIYMFNILVITNFNLE